MTDETARPWYETLFDSHWYDYFATGGPGAPDRDGSYASRTETEVKFVERALGLTESNSVLDLGCGLGRHSLRLASRGHRVTGVDISAYNLGFAAADAEELGVNVTWREADMRDTGLASSSQDAVVNLGVASACSMMWRTSASWRRSFESYAPRDTSSWMSSIATR